jgi:HSP20 family molecular chaperone IbpA
MRAQTQQTSMRSPRNLSAGANNARHRLSRRAGGHHQAETRKRRAQIFCRQVPFRAWCRRRRMSGALLVPMLLNGGCGYEDSRLCAPVALQRWLDRLFDLINDTQRLDAQDNYPPYDIVRTGENAHRISLALAGFSPDEITVTR